MASATRFLRSPRSERTDIVLCALLLGLITLLRLAISNPIEAVGFLYVIPISLLASERGLRGGLIAAAGAILFTACWTVVQGVPLGVLGYGARTITFLGTRCPSTRRARSALRPGTARRPLTSSCTAPTRPCTRPRRRAAGGGRIDAGPVVA